MLAKSKTSAAVMGIIVVLVFAMTNGLFALLWPHLYEKTEVDADLEAKYGSVVFWLLVVALALASGILGAVGISRLDDTHFGWQGALRWAVFGATWALMSLLWKVCSESLEPLWEQWDQSTFSWVTLVKIVMNFVGYLLTGVLPYGLVFKLSQAISTLSEGKEAA